MFSAAGGYFQKTGQPGGGVLLKQKIPELGQSLTTTSAYKFVSLPSSPQDPNSVSQSTSEGSTPRDLEAPLQDDAGSSAENEEEGGDRDLASEKEKRAFAKRTVFSRPQLRAMEERFIRQSFLSREERIDFGEELKLTERQIMIWFQNRRFVL